MTLRNIISDITDSHPFGWLIAYRLQLVIALALILQVLTLLAVMSANSEAENASLSAQEAHQAAKNAEQAALQAVHELAQIRRSFR